MSVLLECKTTIDVDLETKNLRELRLLSERGFQRTKKTFVKRKARQNKDYCLEGNN